MKNRKTEARNHIILSTGVNLFSYCLFYYSPVRRGTGPSSAGKHSNTAELWRWGATTQFFQETGLQVCCWGQRFLQSPPASSRKTTSAWLNPAAFSSPQWGHRFLQTDCAVTCAEPLAPGNQGNQNLLDVPCFSSPQYQTGVQLAGSTDWNTKIRKKQK